MELFRLIDNTWLPGKSFKNFETLAWTERFQGAGDFQLVVNNEISVLNTFPLGCLISHTETDEVMIVENHEFDRTKEGLIITISGRSFETFLENRLTPTSSQPTGTEAGGGVVWPLLTPTDAVLIYLVRLNLVLANAGVVLSVPNVIARKEMRATEIASDQVFRRGDAYTSSLELLAISDAGFKILRPRFEQTTMDVVIYDGSDRTGSIIFSAQHDDLTDAKYLWSIKNYRNMALYSSHDVGGRLFRQKDIAPLPAALIEPISPTDPAHDLAHNPFGDPVWLDRRIAYVEADDILGAGFYDNSRPTTAPGTTDAGYARSQLVLANCKTTFLLSATISETASPKFKVVGSHPSYDIGDLVTVVGEFGPPQVMRVVEHMLTSDKTGTRGYPTLSIFTGAL